MGVRPRNILVLLLLVYSSEIEIIKNAPPKFYEFEKEEEAQITQYLTELDVLNRKRFIFAKKQQEENVAAQAFSGFFSRCYIEIDPSSITLFLKLIIYHEVGHCFGLLHSPDKTNVMYFAARRNIEYNQLDWNKFISLLKSRF